MRLVPFCPLRPYLVVFDQEIVHRMFGIQSCQSIATRTCDSNLFDDNGQYVLDSTLRYKNLDPRGSGRTESWLV
jgi:hypothetical protein